MKGRRGERHKQPLNDFKKREVTENRKEDALDRSLWRTGCGRVYGLSLGSLRNE